MRPEDVDLSLGVEIAFASSERDGRDRWTELAVYHFATPPVPKRHWLSISRGCSNRPGETTKERRLLVGSLERALKLFDPAVDLGIIVSEQAREWEEENLSVAMPERAYEFQRKPDLGLSRGDREAGWQPFPIGDDKTALAWLYGRPVDDLPSVNSMARDLGIGESSLRMALKAGTGVKVPLATIAAVIDREIFLARSQRKEPVDA